MANSTHRPKIGTLRAFVKPSKPTSPVPTVAKNKGYFLIRIHAAQASYTGSRWANLRNAAKQVIVTSEVELKPWIDEPVRQIQVVRRMRPNEAVQLGLYTNLIDWIPTTVDKVSIKLNLILDQKDR